MQESPIFNRTHDLQLWLLRATRNFPRDQRFVMAKRVQQQVFALQDHLVAANRDKAHTPVHLLQADMALISLRKSLLLCHQLTLLTPGQYQHVSQIDAEVGRLLGAWRKQPAGK